MSDEDEDWFESALEDGEEGGDQRDPAKPAEESRDSTDDSDDADPTVEERPPAQDPGEASEGPAFGQVDDSETPPGQTDDAVGTSSDEPSFTDAHEDAVRTRSDEPSLDDAHEDGEELFQDDFAAAFESASGPGGGGFDAGGFDSGADPGGGFDPSGFGGEPFGSEFDDDAEFDSEIPRIDVGIEGLDSMILGGVPERSLMVAIGDAGTGKTTFGLQFLNEGLENGENAVFITLEESRERVLNTAAEKGWNFEDYEDAGQLVVLDMDPIEMANTLQSIRGELPELIREFDASRLVLDSVSLLEMMYDSRSTRRNEIFDFAKSLKRAGVTTMLTSEASEDNPYVSRYGIIEYLTDAVFILRYIRSTDDFRETRLAVEIQKIRDANHSREIKPYEITDSGISVYGQANIF